jgi:hypothetical protein
MCGKQSTCVVPGVLRNARIRETYYIHSTQYPQSFRYPAEVADLPDAICLKQSQSHGADRNMVVEKAAPVNQYMLFL